MMLFNSSHDLALRYRTTVPDPLFTDVPPEQSLAFLPNTICLQHAFCRFSNECFIFLRSTRPSKAPSFFPGLNPHHVPVHEHLSDNITVSFILSKKQIYSRVSVKKLECAFIMNFEQLEWLLVFLISAHQIFSKTTKKRSMASP